MSKFDSRLSFEEYAQNFSDEVSKVDASRYDSAAIARGALLDIVKPQLQELYDNEGFSTDDDADIERVEMIEDGVKLIFRKCR